MMKVMAKAETAISEAQDRNKESPFIDSALEQVKIATTELNNAMKRVSENFWVILRKQSFESNFFSSSFV